ncbi:hypothetical protein FD755_021078 [Muntiacus reevesi]|uniref:Pancreatic progenitor cell differentiation and proliferation factor n=1 Tax=Muntiacus reevesi TaxID=9886 RepID=A0A5N3X268_MUNRE|nr:hypothetical protein FD755_021078 [Muntiacus reevesi]
MTTTSTTLATLTVTAPAEASPHHMVFPYNQRPLKAHPGHWWASFFFRKSTLPFMATVLESPEHSESAQASTTMGKQQPGGQPGKMNCRPPS